MRRHRDCGRIVAIFFTFVVVVVGSEMRMEVTGLDQGRQIRLALQALRPTNAPPRRATDLDIWEMPTMDSNLNWIS